MDSNYHIFKKSVKSKGKTVHKWYFYWNDLVTGVMHQKICKNCKTQAEAYAYVSAQPALFQKEIITIAKIAKWMYIPGSQHMERMEKLGKRYSIETLRCKRALLEIFILDFGNLELQELTVPMVIDYLAKDSHSGSWKNNFLTVVGEVFAEAPFQGINNISIPKFPKFKRNSIRKDVFSTYELNILFDESIWVEVSNSRYTKHPQFNEGHKAMYLMFLCCIECGLRIGEAIGTRVNQFIFDQSMLVVDGFYRHNQLIRTTYNKCGSEDDQKIRVVPLPDDFAFLMKQYILEKGFAADDFVFQRYGKPIRKWLAEEWFKEALEKSGIEIGNRVLTPHSLRYTYITRMRREVAGETVQKIAGHTSLAMTDHYTRAAIPEMVAAVKPAVDAANRLFE